MHQSILHKICFLSIVSLLLQNSFSTEKHLYVRSPFTSAKKVHQNPEGFKRCCPISVKSRTLMMTRSKFHPWFRRKLTNGPGRKIKPGYSRPMCYVWCLMSGVLLKINRWIFPFRGIRNCVEKQIFRKHTHTKKRFRVPLLLIKSLYSR